MRTMMTMIAILILAVACAEGHDIYSGLKDHRGEASCCDERDCRPAHYRVTSAGVEMLLDDEWVRVPDSVVQYRSLHGDTDETGGGHWCGVTNWKQQDLLIKDHLFCFVPFKPQRFDADQNQWLQSFNRCSRSRLPRSGFLNVRPARLKIWLLPVTSRLFTVRRRRLS